MKIKLLYLLFIGWLIAITTYSQTFTTQTSEVCDDVTNLISNPNFDNGDTGWIWNPKNSAGVKAMSTNNPVVTAYHTTYDCSQTLTGLKPGTYKLTVQGYYRTTSEITAYEEYVAGKIGEICAEVYVNNNSRPLMNAFDDYYDQELSSGSFQFEEGKWVPASSGDIALAFGVKKELYLNTVYGYVCDDGKLTFGVRQLSTPRDACYSTFDNFHLYYMGAGEIDEGKDPDMTNIIFDDTKVKTICVKNWDTNGDGELSYDEAAAVTSIGTVFYYLGSITSFNELQFFTGLTSIDDFAFYGCSSLTSVEIPINVKSIGNNAFSGCTSLYTITLPSHVTSIGENAFNGVKYVVCQASNPPTIKDNSLRKGIELYVPKGSIDAYTNSKWKEYASKILDIPKIDEVKVYPSISGDVLDYYDYDGDGVMEMITINGRQTSIRSDSQIIEQGSEFRTKYNIFDKYNDLNFHYLNGTGQFMVGPNIHNDDGSWTRVSDGNLSIIDINNDGRTDFIHLESGGKTYMQQEDGTFHLSTPTFISDSTYIAEKLAEAIANAHAGWGFGIGDWYVYGEGAVPEDYYVPTMDLNGDGFPDLLSSKNDNALISLGENTFCNILFSGSIYPCDLNGDGRLDYLHYVDGVLYSVLTNSDGTQTKQKLFANNNVKNVVCRDFDHDGDVDILAYVTDNSNIYFVIMRNDGNGTFKKKENYISGYYSYYECKDYDADGQYEVMVYNNNGEQRCRIIKIKNDFSLEDVSPELQDNDKKMFLDMGDFDNDGFTDFKLVYNYKVEGSYINNQQHVTGRYSLQTKQNEAPAKMSKPIVSTDEVTGMMSISWPSGADAETSSCDLTYELRIGTAPGKGDVLCAASLADGKRRVIKDGNMGTQRQTLFNIGKHTPGTYYVSVQAIDAGGLGGAWSDEAIYEHTFTAPTIIADNATASTADTVFVVAGAYTPNADYKWSVTNGEVISQELNQAKVIFHRAGAQQVNLTTVYKGDIFTSEPLAVTIAPYKEIRIDNYEGAFTYSLDINQDGYADGVGSHFVINDGKGNLSRYQKSFNADLQLGVSQLLDINKDGYPDVLGYDNTKKQYTMLINDGEGEFEREDWSVTIDLEDRDTDPYYSDYHDMNFWGSSFFLTSSMRHPK